ncbi:hypothetical protein NE865_15431 [Phthorimaea operculella]|nr:hypothetical protein NE865_15431 [Phthorimaea operculella]
MEEVKQTMSEMITNFHTTMAKFQEELHNVNSAPPAQPPSSTSLATEFMTFRRFIVSSLVSLQKQVSLLALETDNLEMRSRRAILLLHGLPEEQEDTYAAVVQLAENKLGLPEFRRCDMSRCFRMGHTTLGKPRPILLEFNDLSTRSTFWSAKKLLKNTGITMSEFLTKSRHSLFMETRKRLGISKCWTRDGVIYCIGSDSQRRRITSAAELEKISPVTENTSNDSDISVQPSAPASEPANQGPSKVKPATKFPVQARTRRGKIK